MARSYTAARRPAALAACAALLSACGEAGPSVGGSRAAAPEPLRASEVAVDAAERYLEGGRPEDALRIARALAARDPSDWRRQELLGRTLLASASEASDAERAERTREAAQAYLAAAVAAPANAPLQHAAGIALDQVGRMDEAAARYRAALEAEPGNGTYAFYAGTAARRMDQLDEAVRLFSQAWRLDDSNALAAAALAEALGARGDLDAALPLAARARELAPADLGVRVTEARLLRKAGRPEESASRLLGLPERERAEEAVAEELGRSLLALQRPAKAAEAWELALAVDGRRWRCAVGAAEAWLAAGDRVRALARLEAAELVAPREPAVTAIAARVRSGPPAPVSGEGAPRPQGAGPP